MPKPAITGFSNVSINSSYVVNSNYGLYTPQLTTTQRGSIPDNVLKNGGIIYNNTTNTLQSYVNNNWVDIGNAAGYVVGPDASVAGNIATFADTSGHLLQDSGVAIGGVPPIALFAVHRTFSNTTINEISKLGHVKFSDSGGIGTIYVDSLSPVHFVENNYSGLNYQIGSVFSGTTPEASTTVSALVELKSTTGALLLSRLTTAQRNALTAPTAGMILYNSSINAFEGYVDNGWKSIISMPALTNGQLIIGSTGNNPVAAVPTNGTNISWTTGAGSLTANLTGQVAVTNGGTGLSSATAYSVLCGGITPTGSFQSVSGLGTSGQVLTSQGANALPIWTSLSSLGVTSIIGTANQVLVNNTSGTPQIGAITLTLPQSIATTSTVQFGGIGIGKNSPTYALQIGTDNSTIPLLYMASTSVPSAPAIANDGIYSVKSGEPKFTSGTAKYTGTIVTANATSLTSPTTGYVGLNGTTGATINSTAVTNDSIILVSKVSFSGVPVAYPTASLHVSIPIGGGSFTIYSTAAGDTDTASFLIINSQYG